MLAVPKNDEASDELSPTNPKFMLYQSRFVAKYLVWDIWTRFDGLCECKATCEIGGEINEVRLKRACIGFGDTEDED